MKSKSKGKKRAKMSIGGGDIGGLVLVGGGFIVAGLFATFIFKRHKRMDCSNGKRSNKYVQKKCEQDYGNQGLHCLLQTLSTTASSNYRGHGDSSTMSVIIQEDGVLSEIDDGIEIQKMVIPDYSEKEIIVLSDDLCAIRDEHGTVDEIPIDEVGKEVHLDEEEEEDGEYVEENKNESFGDTGKGKPSMDLQANAVWPAEIMDTMPQRSVVEEAKTVVAHKNTRINGDIVFNNHLKEKSMKVKSMLMVAMLCLLFCHCYLIFKALCKKFA